MYVQFLDASGILHKSWCLVFWCLPVGCITIEEHFIFKILWAVARPYVKILIDVVVSQKKLFFDSCFSHHTFPQSTYKTLNIFTAAAFMVSSMLGTFILGYELSDYE